jgi:hypothetical protein
MAVSLTTKRKSEREERERVFGRFGFGQPGQGVREVAWFGFFLKINQMCRSCIISKRLNCSFDLLFLLFYIIDFSILKFDSFTLFIIIFNYKLVM